MIKFLPKKLETRQNSSAYFDNNNTLNKLKSQMEISDTQMVGRCSIGVGCKNITTDLCWREKFLMASCVDIPINCYDIISPLVKLKVTKWYPKVLRIAQTNRI